MNKLPGDEWHLSENFQKLEKLLILSIGLLQENPETEEVKFSMSSFDRDGLRAQVVVSTRRGGTVGKWEHFSGTRPATQEESDLVGEVFHLTKVFTDYSSVPWIKEGWAELTIDRKGNTHFEYQTQSPSAPQE
jgi:hypothetical protein